jgi:hypothetical protein
MKQVFYFSSLIATLFLFGCQPDDTMIDPRPEAKLESGVFVVNQGPFQNGTGTISYKPYSTETVNQDFFTAKNPGQVLGNTAQSMIKHGNRFYIAVNNANKIIVTDSLFSFIGAINDIALPRYFASVGSKLYVSMYGADFQSGEVLEINTSTLAISNRIPVGNAPEQMLVDGKDIYVTVSSPYGGDSDEVVVINTITNKIDKKLKVSDSPTSIVKDKTGGIWVLCTGNYAFDPANNTAGSLVKIGATNTTIPLPNGVSNLVINSSKDELFFINGSKVLKHKITDNVLNSSPVYEGAAYALGINKSNVLHIADPKLFSEDGEVHTIVLSNGQKSSFKAGIAPGFFYFFE